MSKMLKKGLFKKYSITKISNPDKEIDGIVLEFDDPIARAALFKWAKIMKSEGYVKVHDDVIRKLNEHTDNQGLFF